MTVWGALSFLHHNQWEVEKFIDPTSRGKKGKLIYGVIQAEAGAVQPSAT